MSGGGKRSLKQAKGAEMGHFRVKQANNKSLNACSMEVLESNMRELSPFCWGKDYFIRHFAPDMVFLSI